MTSCCYYILHFTFIHLHYNALHWHYLLTSPQPSHDNMTQALAQNQSDKTYTWQISIWSCGTYMMMMTSGSCVWLTLNTDCCWCCCIRCCCWSKSILTLYYQPTLHNDSMTFMVIYMLPLSGSSGAFFVVNLLQNFVRNLLHSIQTLLEVEMDLWSCYYNVTDRNTMTLFSFFPMDRQGFGISCLLRRSVTEVRAMHSFTLDGWVLI